MPWFVWPLAGIIILVAAGFLYEAAAGVVDLQRASQYGRFVKLASGKRVFVSATASPGPTVLFESGITASSLHWSALQQMLGASVSTFAYDRLGLGWSSPTSETRLPSIMADELAQVLAQAGLGPPYIIVAHSYGSLIARQFAARCSEDVTGLVLLDPMWPEEWQPSNVSHQHLIRLGIRLMQSLYPLACFGMMRVIVSLILSYPRIFSRLMRLLTGRKGQNLIERSTRELHKMERSVQPEVAAQWSRPQFFRGAGHYFRGVAASIREAEGADPLATVPVIVLRPQSKRPVPGASLRRIGEQVEQRTVIGSGHWIHLDQPAAVLQAIDDMLKVSTCCS